MKPLEPIDTLQIDPREKKQMFVVMENLGCFSVQSTAEICGMTEADVLMYMKLYAYFNYGRDVGIEIGKNPSAHFPIDREY